MTALSRSRRAAAGIAFLVAGALVLLDSVLRLAGVTTLSWLSLLSDWALTVGFVLLAVATRAVVVRVAAVVAAVGWFLLGLGTVVGLPPGFGLLAIVAAAAGGVVAAVVLYTGKEITDRSAIVFIVTTAIAALLLLGAVAGIPLGVVATLLTLLFGAGLVVTGVLFSRVQFGRRR